MKTIEYFTRNVWGKPLQYIKEKGDADIFRQLTGKATITGAERELLRELSGGAIDWQQVIDPAANSAIEQYWPISR